MVKNICLLFGMIVALSSCDTRLRPLTMDKTPYTGDELRIDGYYYSDLTDFDKYTGEWKIEVAVFYEDGVCIHTGLNTTQDHPENLRRIENEILLNKELIARAKNVPWDIGVFKVEYPNIIVEHWAYRAETVSRYGEVIDNNTFVINKVVSNRSGDTYFSGSLTYHFQPFAPLPDVTNKYTRAFED